MSYDASQVAFIDTETTGLDPERHHVWEVAVIVNGVEHVWQHRLPVQAGVRWDTHVDPWVLENTGIRDRYVYDTALSAYQGVIRFARLTHGRHLVGACPWFDSERMHRLWIATSPPDRQHPWHYHLIDVETLIVGHLASTARFDGNDWHTTTPALPWDSRELSRLVGIDPGDFAPAHTALTDARWAKACFEAVMGETENQRRTA